MAERSRMREVFDKASQLSGVERSAYLDGACAGDAALRAEVERQLEGAERSDPFPSGPTAELGVAPGAASGPLWQGPGSRIGAYRLLQQIGEGGFGAVFMAEQEQPVRRRVALKVIKLGMDTHQVVARFEQERQALALMDHPHIARVLDAGVTAAGRPFFVMELVKGEPITAYCDANSLTVQERLELFAQVCAAVQHAHTKGIIHRDIKPSNVLVSTQDGRAFAKVIDFGVAKATAARLTERTLFTEHRQLVGTPEYMSPEQAAGSLDIDTRTDVYSLGVLLYELLTGSTPFEATILREAALAEMQRIIREVTPAKPSTRLSQEKESAAGVAARRRTEPRRLGALVRGGLDWIVMKALEKDRARRYETANGLAMDVRRYLDGEAVVAAPPSAMYRARTFVKRHRRGVAAAGLVGLALVLGITGTSVGLHRATIERRAAEDARRSESAQRQAAERMAEEERRQRERAVAAREEADRERRKADAINEFIRGALVSADPNKGGRQGMLVADAMAQSLKLLDEGAFAGEPDVEVELRGVIAEVLSLNARGAEAVPIAQRALEIARRTHGGDSPEVVNALLRVAGARMSSGRSDLGEALAREALAMNRRLKPGDDVTTARALKGVAGAIANQGKHAEALPVFEETMQMRRRLHAGVDDRGLAQSVNDYAFALTNVGKAEEGLKLFRESLEMRRRLFPGDHPDVAESLNNVGWALDQLGRFGEAAPEHRASLEMYERLFAGDHGWKVRGMYNLARSLLLLGSVQEAYGLFTACAEMRSRLDPGAEEGVAADRAIAGLCALELGREEEGDGLLAAAQEWIARSPVMAGVSSGAWQSASLVRAVAPSDPERGARLSALTLASGRRRLAPGSRELATDLMTHGSNVVLLGGVERVEEGERALREALAIREASAPDDPSALHTQLVRVNLAGAIYTRERLRGAGGADAARLREVQSLLAQAIEGMEEDAGGTQAAWRDAYLKSAGDMMRRVCADLENAEPDAGHGPRGAEWAARVERARRAAGK